jgi:hypothetical protein
MNRSNRFMRAMPGSIGYLEPGLVYPLWGAAHYFRVPAAADLVARLLAYLERMR